MSLLERLKHGKTKTISVPDSDEKVNIRSLTMREMQAFQKAHESPDVDHLKLMLELIVQGVVDENGAAVWSKADVESLNDLPVSAISHIAAEVVKFSGVTPAKNG